MDRAGSFILERPANRNGRQIVYSDRLRVQEWPGTSRRLRASSGSGVLHGCVVTKSNVHEDAAARSFKAEYQSFRVGRALRSALGGMKLGRVNAEMESLIVERGHGISDDLVG